jgi:hypothetical protein
VPAGSTAELTGRDLAVTGSVVAIVRRALERAKVERACREMIAVEFAPAALFLSRDYGHPWRYQPDR